MTRKLITILCAALGLAGLAGLSYAERPWVGWTPEDGVTLRQGYHTEWYRGGEGRYLGENSGEVSFIWSDTRHGDRGVYLEVVSVDEDLKFGNAGIKITDAVNRQEDPQVWPSTDGGWYVGWEDFDADTLGDIYCTKIDAEGRRVEGWGGEVGVAVCIYEGIQADIRIVDDGQGGCIIAWSDARGGDTSDLYAQHILANGRVDPNWRENGTPIVQAQGSQSRHTADSDGLGGMIIGWQDGRLGQNSDIWAQRITPRGQLVWGNGQGIQVCATGSNQEGPKLCPDGAGGAFFSWVDDRNLQDSDRDIYCQRVTADGQLMWPADGEAVVIEASEQTEQRIVNNSSGEAIICWLDKRRDDLTYDVYAMRISGVNRMRKEWDPPTGVPVFVEARNQQGVRLFPDAQGGAYFAVEDERERGYPEVDIWVHHLNRNGARLWAENGIPACRAMGNQNSPLIRRTANGGCVVAWGDYRSGSQEIWAQAFTYEGDTLWAADGIPLVEGIGGNATAPKALPRGNGSFTVFWLDGRFGSNGTVPFIANVTDAGDNAEIEYMTNGIPAQVGTIGGGINPDAAAGPNGETFVVWEDHRIGGDLYSIYAQKITANGERSWGDAGLKVAEYGREQTMPRVCSDGSDGIYIAWRAPSDSGDNNIFIQMLDANGTRLWGDSAFLMAGKRADEVIEDMQPDGEGGIVISWQVSTVDSITRQWDDNIWIDRINANRERLWDQGEGGLPVVNEIGRQRTSRFAKHPLGYMVVWVDGRQDYGDGEPGNDIWGQFIRNDGTIAWRENGLVLTDINEHQDNPSITITGHGFVYMVWEDFRGVFSGTSRDIYVQKFNPILQGNAPVLLFGNEGRRLCNSRYNQIKPNIQDDGQFGVYVGWEDYRNGGVWSDVYALHLTPRGNRYPGWRDNGNLICGAFHRQEGVQLINLTPTGERGAVAVWEDKRSTGKEELSNVYVQKFKSDPLIAEFDPDPIVPTKLAIEAVYPNPFNSSAIITYSIQYDSNVMIGLYDASGRRVRNLGSRDVMAGTHRLVLDGEQIPTGSYFLRLQSDFGTVERQIQLIK
jgi:hypothetical protein